MQTLELDRIRDKLRWGTYVKACFVRQGAREWELVRADSQRCRQYELPRSGWVLVGIYNTNATAEEIAADIEHERDEQRAFRHAMRNFDVPA